jgi:hypothetical protein
MTRSASPRPIAQLVQRSRTRENRRVGVRTAQRTIRAAGSSSSLTHSSSRAGTHSYTSMSSMSSESPMLVDEPDHHANPFRVPLALLHQGRLGLAFRMKESSFICETLESLVCQDDDDDDVDDAKIQYSLRFVWLTVQEALLEGPGVIERLADRDGFEASVEPDGEKRS